MYGIEAKFPKWYCRYDSIYYSKYFKNILDESLSPELISNHFREPNFEYSLIPQFNGYTDLHGYFQSDKYFQHCIEDIKYFLEPQDFLIARNSEKYKMELDGDTCSVHIRRGDYIGNRIHDI